MEFLQTAGRAGTEAAIWSLFREFYGWKFSPKLKPWPCSFVLTCAKRFMVERFSARSWYTAAKQWLSLGLHLPCPQLP